mmetsp:Transcript_98031/g.305296  ORF Transcript_98031/g.305296 Transcript_98031/m.305296 type:complete len:246 (-) Transcript_98031:57-794(-)
MVAGPKDLAHLRLVHHQHEAPVPLVRGRLGVLALGLLLAAHLDLDSAPSVHRELSRHPAPLQLVVVPDVHALVLPDGVHGELQPRGAVVQEDEGHAVTHPAAVPVARPVRDVHDGRAAGVELPAARVGGVPRLVVQRPNVEGELEDAVGVHPHGLQPRGAAPEQDLLVADENLLLLGKVVEEDVEDAPDAHGVHGHVQEVGQVDEPLILPPEPLAAGGGLGAGDGLGVQRDRCEGHPLHLGIGEC